MTHTVKPDLMQGCWETIASPDWPGHATEWRIRKTVGLFLLLWLLQMLPASASAPHTCDLAAQRVAAETQVPLSVLRSITRTETGRNRGGRLEPWPWTVNMEGKGNWFDTEDQARAYVFKHFKRGARSFDVGCFQINYKWHHKAFTSIDQMFDPLENARYAAVFLQRLYDETGDWSRAAGAYHSRTPEYAQRYRTRFDRIHSKMDDQPRAVPIPVTAPAPTHQVPRKRNNTFPLLQQASTARSIGSLVPLGQSAARALVGLSQDQTGS